MLAEVLRSADTLGPSQTLRLVARTQAAPTSAQLSAVRTDLQDAVLHVGDSLGEPTLLGLPRPGIGVGGRADSRTPAASATIMLPRGVWMPSPDGNRH